MKFSRRRLKYNRFSTENEDLRTFFTTPNYSTFLKSSLIIILLSWRTIPIHQHQSHLEKVDWWKGDWCRSWLLRKLKDMMMYMQTDNASCSVATATENINIIHNKVYNPVNLNSYHPTLFSTDLFALSAYILFS